MLSAEDITKCYKDIVECYLLKVLPNDTEDITECFLVKILSNALLDIS